MTNFQSDIPVILLRGEKAGPVSDNTSYAKFQMRVYAQGCAVGGLGQGTKPTFSTRSGLRLHGQVSREFPKLSYRVELQDEAGHDKPATLLGLPADADWVLQGPWLDKSLIRNAFSYDLARAMGIPAMRTRVCELFVNTNGQALSMADYVGVYQLTEQIKRAAARVPLTGLAPDQTQDSEISGGYLLSWDVGRGTYLRRWNHIQVRYPKSPAPEQLRWLDDWFTKFDDALKGAKFSDPLEGYAAYIDVDSWADYILFEELIFNLDGYVRSFFMHKERGAKLRPGPVWDHDLALGHQFPRGTSFEEWWYVRRAAPHGWIPRLMADPKFARRMAERWHGSRRGPLSDAALAARVDQFAQPLLSGAADRNFARWQVLAEERPFPKPNDYITIASQTYPEQISALKHFVRQRASWMDAHLKFAGE